jgi:membrane protein
MSRLLHGPVDALGGVAVTLALALEGLFRDRGPQYAAAIAFHVLFSLFPLTILLVSIFGLVLQDDQLRSSVIDELVDVLPVSPSGEEDVRSSIEQIASPLSALGLLFLVALLWGASGMMAAIRVGLETALKADRGRPPAHAKLVDFVLVGLTGVLVLAVIGLSAFATLFARAVDYVSERIGIEVITSPTGALVRDGVQLALIAVMTLLLYRVAPGRKLRRSAALAGAILTAVGIWGAAKLLAVLLDLSRYSVIYGSITGVMTFLIFVYVVALILLLGAEFAYEQSQPAGPPGPPIGTRLKGFLRGLVVYEEPREGFDDPFDRA